MHDTIKSWWERMGPICQELLKDQSPREDPHYDSAEHLNHRIEASRQQ